MTLVGPRQVSPAMLVGAVTSVAVLIVAVVAVLRIVGDGDAGTATSAIGSESTLLPVQGGGDDAPGSAQGGASGSDDGPAATLAPGGPSTTEPTTTTTEPSTTSESTTTTEPTTTTTEPTTTTTLANLTVALSRSSCGLGVLCPYSMRGTGATPDGALTLRITDDDGADIRNDGYEYSSRVVADSRGRFDLDFQTVVRFPDTHTFTVVDDATGRSASDALRFRLFG